MEKIVAGDIVALKENYHNMLSEYPLGTLFHVTDVLNDTFVRVRPTKQKAIISTTFHINRFTPILRRK